MTEFSVAMFAPDIPRTYPHDHLRDLTDEDWRAMPAVGVRIDQLIPTQEAVSLADLAKIVNGGEPNGGDGWTGRAVRWNGRLYLHDGHTRWVIAWLTGHRRFWVRIAEGRTEP